MKGPRAGWSVLVTGASSGLGRAIAVELAQAGCDLVLTARNRGRLEETAEACRAAGSVRVTCFEADLAAEAGVQDLVARLGPELPDALVNNAGAGRAGPWGSGSAEGDAAQLQLLIGAPLALTRALLPSWRLQGRGALLNVASTGAFQPGPLTAVYYAAKSFLFNWSVALAREERSWLAVTTLCPGALKTGFSESAGKRDVPGAPGPERTARAAVQAWKKGRGVVVPGLFNKAAVVVSRWIPPAWSAAAVEAVQRSVQIR